MGDVLTKEEAFSLALTTARLADSPRLVSEEESRLAGAVTRLVSEVERLRARNEALEKVAKAANASPCRHSSEARGDNCSLCMALSALAEPGKGGAT